ncbi:uncharacterized protein TNCV_3732861 [Trichonephila clavipes]|nr:uncharacterized protein TNCV_3732861 [Trichonephila clavipes]
MRSLPGSWSEQSRKLKMGRKGTLAYHRALESGSGGPGRKIRRGIGSRVDKRTNNNNDLPQFRKKVRSEKTVLPSTGGYNLRPRRGAKVESRQPMRRQFESDKAENICIAPTLKNKQGQAAGILEAEVVNRIAREGTEERTAADPSPWRS